MVSLFLPNLRKKPFNSINLFFFFFFYCIESNGCKKDALLVSYLSVFSISQKMISSLKDCPSPAPSCLYVLLKDILYVMFYMLWFVSTSPSVFLSLFLPHADADTQTQTRRRRHTCTPRYSMICIHNHSEPNGTQHSHTWVLHYIHSHTEINKHF